MAKTRTTLDFSALGIVMFVGQRYLLECAVLFQQQESTSISTWTSSSASPISSIIRWLVISDWILTRIDVVAVDKAICIVQRIIAHFTSFPNYRRKFKFKYEWISKFYWERRKFGLISIYRCGIHRASERHCLSLCHCVQ